MACQHLNNTTLLHMIPLTLWGKDSGEDFKVLVAVHVDVLHLEDQKLAH